MSNLAQFQTFAKFTKQKTIQNNKTVIYTRVSDVKQQDNTSLDSQKKYCTDYALKKALEICGYFGGTVESAKTDDRKEFKRMLAFVKQKKIANIIAYSIDRFSRAGASAIATVEELSKKGINVLSVTQPVKAGTSTGSFFQNIHLLFSKYDNDQRREKTITGMRQRLLNGYWIGTTPFGYKNCRNEQNKPIIIPDDNARWVKKMFQWKAKENISNVEIVKRLDKCGLKIYKQRLTRIFRNPVYCGLITHGLLDGQIIKGIHEPIVSRALFLRVNGIQARNPQDYKQNKANENLPLKGFAQCKNCNDSLTGYIVKRKGIYYYKCKTIGCSCNRNANALHDQFEELISKYQIDPNLMAPLKIQLEHTFKYFNKSNEDNAASLKYNLKALNEKIEKIEERFVLGEIDGDLYQKFIGKFREDKEGIEQEIENSNLKSSNLENYINQSLKLLANLNNIWASGNYNTKQNLQKLLFPNGIVYDRENDEVRTSKVNVFLELTSCLTGNSGDIKKGQKANSAKLSSLVAGTGLEPVTFGL